jgi:ribosomal protein S18 acetylase RimI-like enzyme
MRCQTRTHGEIEAWLAADVCSNLFPLYVCRMRPEAVCVVAVSSRRVRACLIAGARLGLAPAGRAWLIADDETAADCLFAAAVDEGLMDGLQLPWRFRGLAHRLSNVEVAKDLYLVRPEGCAVAGETPGALLAITAAVEQGAIVSAELKPLIGDLQTLPEGFEMWAWVDCGRVVALADTIVRYEQVMSIQQVYTVSDARRRGYARAMVARILRLRENEAVQSIWLVAAGNTPSIRLAEELGFRAHSELGCVGSISSPRRQTDGGEG